MDPITCCLLGICCPPFSQEQREALTKVLTAHYRGDAEKAATIVDVVFDDFAKATVRIRQLSEG